MIRVGLDVGGTNTDAVMLDGEQVVGFIKVPTTQDVTSGIVHALGALLEHVPASLEDIRAVMIGTTHFTNAFIEGKRLSSVAAVRLGLPATRSLPPLIDWPDTARAALVCRQYLCHGGHEYDGRPISEVDRDELLRVADDIFSSGLESISITSVFSPANPEHELMARDVFAEELPHLPITMSHEIGRMGLLERENAAIINASLRSLSTIVTAGFAAAVSKFGLDARLFLSQNDGTLGTLDFAERYPVSTFTSGPTNSMRGAAFLSGLNDAMVLDVGGTTSDIGVLQNGFPRQASTNVRVGGVRTNFRLPDVLSLGIGGGSLVDGAAGTAGPTSVGHEITRRARVFGGDTLTATDLAVASGRAHLGDPATVKDLCPILVRDATKWIDRQIEDGLDRMRVSSNPVPLILVGGGSMIISDDVGGVSTIVRPPHFGVANAVGAAIAQVGAVTENVYSYSKIGRAAALQRAVDDARQLAVDAGALAHTVQVVDIDEINMAYLPGHVTVIKVKTIGELDLGAGHALHR